MTAFHRPFAPFVKTVTMLALCLAVVACASGPSPEEVQNKDHAATLIKIADDTRAGGDFVSALTLYRQVHEQNPHDPVPLARMGATLMEVGNYAEAAGAWRAALELKPHEPAYHRGLALALLAQGEAEKAMAELRPVLAQDGDDPRVYNALGIAHDMLGHHHLAQQDYRRAMRLAPTNVGFRNNYGMSLALAGNYADAISILSDVANAPDALPRYRLNLALVYGLSGDQVRAAATAREVLGEHAVQNNLASYAVLRAMNEQQRTAAIMGAELHGAPLPAIAADTTPPAAKSTEKLVTTIPLPAVVGAKMAAKLPSPARAAPTPTMSAQATKPAAAAEPMAPAQMAAVTPVAEAPAVPLAKPAPSAPLAPPTPLVASASPPSSAPASSSVPPPAGQATASIAPAPPSEAQGGTAAPADLAAKPAATETAATGAGAGPAAPPPPQTAAGQTPMAVAAIPPKAAPAPVSLPSPPSEAAAPASAKPAVAKPAVLAAGTPAPSPPSAQAETTAVPAGHFVVQLGAFSIEAYAKKLVARCAEKGMTVSMTRSVDRQQRVWFVVRTAAFASAEAAQSALQQAQAIGGVQPEIMHLSAARQDAREAVAAAPARPE